ncbi:hypothetical protein CEXT_388811 [Caerostris extrusa]|uniref:Uncharacterized protein n=1 Tax=Caerostris extrusa TaxID=172846 RepID=A0AAV4YEC1_CAEEX|nr:hypothetical protein CEXT_388811 [Caerostris extrusa]
MHPPTTHRSAGRIPSQDNFPKLGRRGLSGKVRAKIRNRSILFHSFCDSLCDLFIMHSSLLTLSSFLTLLKSQKEKFPENWKTHFGHPHSSIESGAERQGNRFPGKLKVPAHNLYRVRIYYRSKIPWHIRPPPGCGDNEN